MIKKFCMGLGAIALGLIVIALLGGLTLLAIAVVPFILGALIIVLFVLLGIALVSALIYLIWLIGDNILNKKGD